VIHPLSKALPSRVTPELEYFQAKWAAHLPYRQATGMLKEVLPLDKGIRSRVSRSSTVTASHDRYLVGLSARHERFGVHLIRTGAETFVFRDQLRAEQQKGRECFKTEEDNNRCCQ